MTGAGVPAGLGQLQCNGHDSQAAAEPLSGAAVLTGVCLHTWPQQAAVPPAPPARRVHSWRCAFRHMRQLQRSCRLCQWGCLLPGGIAGHNIDRTTFGRVQVHRKYLALAAGCPGQVRCTTLPLLGPQVVLCCRCCCAASLASSDTLSWQVCPLPLGRDHSATGGAGTGACCLQGSACAGFLQR